jgi:RNA polymerase sigma factor (sigma-70 family)
MLRGCDVTRVATGSPMDDVELNERFRAGDEAAVRLVYERHGRAMFATAMSVLGDRELAADAVQLAFVKAWRASSSYDPGRDLRPWLATITRRVAIDVYRREAQSRRSEPRADVEPSVIPLAFERTWEAFEVRTALDRLPDEEREIVRLAHFGGLSHSEIAEKLRVPIGTVKSRSSRAHRRLATLLSHLVEAAR